MATVTEVEKEGYIPYPKPEEVREPVKEPKHIPRPTLIPVPIPA